MSDNLDQVPFGGAEFAENPEPRCPCLLLLDTSGSMNGPPIQELNDGLATFKDAIAADAMALKRVEVAIVSFGPVQVQSEFQTVDTFSPPSLVASGDTPMGAAIEKGLSMLEDLASAGGRQAGTENLGTTYAGFACAGLESPSQQPTTQAP
jgi:hypothetical protein